jgi:hypothetical protein
MHIGTNMKKKIVIGSRPMYSPSGVLMHIQQGGRAGIMFEEEPSSMEEAAEFSEFLKDDDPNTKYVCLYEADEDDFLDRGDKSPIWKRIVSLRPMSVWVTRKSEEGEEVDPNNSPGLDLKWDPEVRAWVGTVRTLPELIDFAYENDAHLYLAFPGEHEVKIPGEPEMQITIEDV